MKAYKTEEIKNLALLGNAGCGKTTLAEAMLFEGGVINRRGDIASGNTVSDHNPIEQEYNNSVLSTLLYTEFNDKKINFIDVPGVDDLSGSAYAALNVADTGLLMVNTANGIEAGTENHIRIADENKTPLIFVANHLDHENVNFDQMIDNSRALLGNKVTIVQYPVATGPGFNQVVDVLKMKMYQWGPDGGTPEILDIPEAEMGKAEELQNELIEKAAENDEALMELYFEKGSLSEEEMRQGMRVGMLDRTLFPVFCTCAKKDMGVRRLMEFVCNIVPAPNELKQRKIESGKEVKIEDGEPTSLFVFKTSVESHVGEVIYFKVQSGKVSEGMDLINTTKGSKERIAQLYAVAGKNRTKVTEMHAGDIGATVKLKETKLNDTLSTKEADVKFAPITFPNPRMRVAIKAVSESDDEKVGESLHKLNFEDPTYVIEYSRELKQLLVHSQGEYHMNVLKWFFANQFKIDIAFNEPKIPYRETITKIAQADYRHKKQSGGSGQFGEVHMVIEPYEEGMADPKMYNLNGKEQKMSVRDKQEYPLQWGGKLIFYNCIVGGSIDARFLPAILKGIMEKIEEGPLTGSYARDICVCIYDGKMHPVDSNEISFKLAGRHAFATAFKQAGPKILEPIYDLNVWVPSDRMGDVMSDLQGRRAMIMGMGSERGYEKITAKVPLKEMNKYVTSLSSITGGRGRFDMTYASYEKVPADVQEELLAAYEAEMAEE